MSHKFVTLVVIFIILHVQSALAASRKSSLNLSDKQTIVTEYINHPQVRSRRLSSIWIPPGTIQSLNEVLEEHEVVPNSGNALPYIVFEEHVPVLSNIIEAGINFNSVETAKFIQNNNNFRRDNLNNNSKADHYVMISEPCEGGNSKIYRLVEIDDNLHIKNFKDLNSDEIESIYNIEEEVIYNAILYELPTQVFTATNLADTIADQINSRVNNFILSEARIEDNYILPLRGLWAKEIISFVHQNKTTDIDAFKSRNNSVVLGIDALIGDTITIGGAYGLSNNKTHFTSSSSKENIDIHTINIYSVGSQNNTNIFYQITGGKVFVKNSRDLFYDNKLIASKHSGNLINTVLSYSQKYSTASEFIIPKLSLNYSYVSLNPFKENGVLISKSLTRKISVIPSIRIGKHILYKELSIIPSIKYDLIIQPLQKHKKANIKILHNDLILSASKSTYQPEGHRIGGEIEVAGKSLKFSLSCDYLLQEKNHSHTVALSLRYEF